MTLQREPCGANCALQQSAGAVPRGAGFRCPNAECGSRLQARIARGLRSVSKAAELRECEESVARGDGEEAGMMRMREVLGLGVKELEICGERGEEKEESGR